MASIERTNWLAYCGDILDFFTDHNNLIFIFDPLTIMPDIGQATTRKVFLWSTRMSLYNYLCIQISGDENVSCDQMTRWKIPETIRRLITILPLPPTFKDFTWLTVSSISAAQDKYYEHRPAAGHYSTGLWLHSSRSVWIPTLDDELQMRLFINAHTGAAGNFSATATN